MDFFENFFSAWKILSASKLRSFLTMLGIIIGVMSVIIVMSVGAGAQSLILNQLKSMGSDLVAVMPGASEDDGPPPSMMGIVMTSLKYEDGEEILKQAGDHVSELAMYVNGNDIVTYGANKTSTNFVGTTASYIEVENTTVKTGRFFTEDEERSSAKVVVLGSEVVDNLFGDQDPVGRRIKIKKVSFTIIGTMKERGISGFQNQDDQVFVPLKTAQKLLLGIDHISLIRAKLVSPDNVDKSLERIKEILRDKHDLDRGDKNDFTARSMSQGLDVISSITDALKFFLVAISAIALVVGGFGIMNIMLANVQERTREIGLRKALGAKTKDISNQFLIESVVITFVGGIIGIIIGILISVLVAKIAQGLGYKWDLVITFSSILLGCGVSIGIGLIFGIIPARRASKLNPIEALRYE